MTQLSPKILELTRTHEQYLSLMTDIDLLLSHMFQNTTATIEDSLVNHVGQETAQAIKNDLQENNIELSDHDQVKNYLEGLKESLSESKILHLILPIDPTFQFLTEISVQLRKKINPSLVIQVSRDPLIVGGAIVIYEGRYYNQSLSRKIQLNMSKYSKRSVNASL